MTLKSHFSGNKCHHHYTRCVWHKYTNSMPKLSEKCSYNLANKRKNYVLTQ